MDSTQHFDCCSFGSNPDGAVCTRSQLVQAHLRNDEIRGFKSLLVLFLNNGLEKMEENHHIGVVFIKQLEWELANE